MKKLLEKADLKIKRLNLSSPLSFESLKRLKNSFKFDFDVYLPTKKINLQRPLVWNLNQRRMLIISLFKERIGSYNGIKLIPPISAIYHRLENGESIFQIVDGKQRLSTLFDFIENKFSLEVNHKEYPFKDLSKELQSIILYYNPSIIVKNSYYDDIVSDQEKEHLNKLLK